MKKIIALLITAVMIASVLWTVPAAADEGDIRDILPAGETAADEGDVQDTPPTEEPAAGIGEVEVVFSTGETSSAVLGEPFVFFFRCEDPGDLGEPEEGEEGAGITVSSGIVEYSHVFIGGMNDYPVSEMVTVTGFEEDFTVFVTETATQMDAEYTIYFTQEEIETAIREAEEKEAQTSEDPTGTDSEGGDPAGADPAGGDPEGTDPAGGEPEGETPGQGGTPESGIPEGETPAQDGTPDSGEPAGSEPAESEPAKNEPSKSEPVRQEAPRQDPPKPEPPKNENPPGQAAAVKQEEQKQEKEELRFTPYSGKEGYTVYDVKMLLQAGYQEFRNYSTQGRTLQSGIGFADPFGEACYYAGAGFPESYAVPEDIYVSDWMDANFDCGLFCIYHTAAGDLYAWDGVYGLNRKDPPGEKPDEDAHTAGQGEGTDTGEETGGPAAMREDVRIGFVAGGTGRFRGAYGVLIGSTSSSGRYDAVGEDVTLPQSLFRDMEGYVAVPEKCETTSLYKVTQEIAEDTSELEVCDTDYAMVPVTLRMQAGSLEDSDKEGGGIGSFSPFSKGILTMDTVDCPAAEEYDIRDYVNDNWRSAYGRPEFVTFHINDGIASGDIYAYRFSYATILDPSSELAQSGTETAEVFLMIDGTDDFKGVTGIMSGVCAAADPAGWGTADYGNDVPLSRQIRAEGYMKVPAASPAAMYGSDIITCEEE